VINGNYFSLITRWNFIPPSPTIFSNYTVDVLKEAMKNPAIIHVAGPNKPWKYLCNAQYQNIYRTYRKNTPWPKMEYKDKTIKNMVKKYVVGNFEKLIGAKNLNVLKAHALGKEKFWTSKIAKMRVR